MARSSPLSTAITTAAPLGTSSIAASVACWIPRSRVSSTPPRGADRWSTTSVACPSTALRLASTKYRA